MIQQVEITMRAVRRHSEPRIGRTRPCRLVVPVADCPLRAEYVCLLVAKIHLTLDLFERRVLRIILLVVL